MEAKVKITNLKGHVWEERKDGNGDDVVIVLLLELVCLSWRVTVSRYWNNKKNSVIVVLIKLIAIFKNVEQYSQSWSDTLMHKHTCSFFQFGSKGHL